MSSLAYVNGRYLPLSQATVPVEDRGLQFADSVYEVCVALNGRLLDWSLHLERLRRSLDALAIERPMSDGALTLVARRLIAASHNRHALVYLQVSRGVARRDHGFPAGVRPSIVATVRAFDPKPVARRLASGVAVVTTEELRWARRDIKSTALLPNVLAKQAARSAGAFEAWFVEGDGTVTEGASTNAWIVTGDGRVVTRPPSPAILAGVMRATLVRLARSDRIPVEERPFTRDELAEATEAFLTATTSPCVPVISVDGRPIGDGRPGPVGRRLAALLSDEIERQTGYRF